MNSPFATPAEVRTPALVEPLEDRRLFAVVIPPPAAGTLVFIGDGAADTVNIFDNGIGLIQGTKNGAAFGPFPGINHVVVDAGGGNDRVSYTFTGNLANDHRVEVGLGDGDDHFRVVDNYNVFNPQLSVSAAGGEGNDELRAYFVSDVDNRLDLVLGGDAGNDYVLADVTLRSVSTGTVFARARGGDGDDAVDLLVHKANPADPTVINAWASGGNGVDTVTRSVLANNDATCEVVVVVP